jgi:hypothetical protein
MFREKQNQQQQSRGNTSGSSSDKNSVKDGGFSSSPLLSKSSVTNKGVLIPPTFGVCLEPTPPPSSVVVSSCSSSSHVVEPYSLPHYWVHHYTASPISQFLQRQSHISHRILGREHMQSGLCIRANPSSQSTNDNDNDEDISVIATLLAADDPRCSSSANAPVLGATSFLFPNSGCISLAKLWHSSTDRSHFGFAVRSATTTTAVAANPAQQQQQSFTTTNPSFVSTTGATFLSYDPLGLSIFATAANPDATNSFSSPFLKMGMMYSKDSINTTTKHTVERTKFGIGSSIGFSTTDVDCSTKHTNSIYQRQTSSLIVPTDMTVWLALRRPVWSFGLQVVAPFLQPSFMENQNISLIPYSFQRIFQAYQGFDFDHTFSSSIKSKLDTKFMATRPISHSFFFNCHLTSGGSTPIQKSQQNTTLEQTEQPFINDSITTRSASESPVLLSIYATTEAPSSITINDDLNHNKLTTISACLSQIITFDRKVYNVLEDRCPTIRNTAVWALEVKHSITPSFSSLSTGTTATKTTANNEINNISRPISSSILSAAVAYQLNRNIATKVHLDNMGFSAALLCKKWSYPSIVVSLIGGLDGFQLRPYFGLGIQVESDQKDFFSQSSTIVDRKKAEKAGYPPKKEKQRKAPSAFV